MTMFPQLSEAYYVDNDHNILKLMDYVYSKYIQINQSFWSEADIDNRFKIGDQTLYNDIYGNLPAFRKRSFNFNIIRPTVNMICGYQRQHRKSTICTPIENADQATADQFTKLLYHANTKGHILETISDAFEGAVTCGMNLLGVWMDYRSDPVNGDFCIDNLGYSAYLIDPFFKRMDLSDCNSLWTRKYVSRAQAKALLPGREPEIEGMRGWGNRDGKFQYMPEAYNYGMQDLLIYDEFWYLDSRKQKMLCDIESGETTEWRGKDEDLQDFLSLYPQVVVLNQEIPTVKLAIVVQGRVFYHGENPLGIDRYPFVPCWGYYEPQVPYFPWRVQGVCRAMRDPQYLYNRRLITMLDIFESQINSGMIYKEGAPVNPKDVFLSGQGRAMPVKDNYDPNADIRIVAPPAVDPSMVQLADMLKNMTREVTGVNEELLGAAQDDKAGILSMLRQGAGLTTLQTLFDNLDFCQKMLGDLQIQLIQANWTPGKVQRILGDEPTEQFYNRAFGKYDSIVEEGLNTSTQKQFQFAQLLQMKEMGLPIPTSLLIESSTLQNKDELMEAIQAEEEMAQKQSEEQSQVQMEVLKAQIEDLKAKAMANEGLGHERASRIAENNALAVERIAAAQRERDMGTLDKIRATKEIQDMDLGQLERAVALIRIIQEAEEADAMAAAKRSTQNSQQMSQPQQAPMQQMQPPIQEPGRMQPAQMNYQ
jgi:hypothetical protein